MVVTRFRMLPSRKTPTLVRQTPCSCAQEQNGFTTCPLTYGIFQQMSTFVWMCQYSSSTLFTQDTAKPSRCVVSVPLQLLLGTGRELSAVTALITIISHLKHSMPVFRTDKCSELFTRHSLQSAPCRAPAALLVSWESRDMQLPDQQGTLWRCPGLWIGMQSLVFQMS